MLRALMDCASARCRLLAATSQWICCNCRELVPVSPTCASLQAVHPCARSQRMSVCSSGRLRPTTACTGQRTRALRCGTTTTHSPLASAGPSSWRTISWSRRLPSSIGSASPRGVSPSELLFKPLSCLHQSLSYCTFKSHGALHRLSASNAVLLHLQISQSFAEAARKLPFATLHMTKCAASHVAEACTLAMPPCTA